MSITPVELTQQYYDAIAGDIIDEIACVGPQVVAKGRTTRQILATFEQKGTPRVGLQIVKEVLETNTLGEPYYRAAASAPLTVYPLTFSRVDAVALLVGLRTFLFKSGSHDFFEKSSSNM